MVSFLTAPTLPLPPETNSSLAKPGCHLFRLSKSLTVAQISRSWNRRRISRERQRGFQDLVSIGMMRRVEGEQPFGECRAVLDGEFSHRTDLAVASGDQLVAREARMPFVQAVEVPHGRPDLKILESSTHIP